jgi:aminomethyltransferase
LPWNKLGFDVTIENESEAVVGLAVQGPTSCTVLTLLGCHDLNQLKPFGIAHYTFEGQPLMVSRTGFTGDLGYEVWIPPESAEALWDQLFEVGHDYLIKPIGSYALELARIEAGFLQANVDFMPAEEVVRVGRTRSPFELGLSWLVDFSKPLFNGRSALLKEQANGSRYRFAMLDVEGNKACRALLYSQGRQTSGHRDLRSLVPDSQGQHCLRSNRDALWRRGRRTGCGNLLPA